MILRCKLETEKIISLFLCSSCPSCSHDFCPYLRYFYFLLSIEEQRQKAARDVLATQKILQYNLNLVFREMFWRAC